MIVRSTPLASLRADASDRFDGIRYLYPNRRPITRLRLVGALEGQWYYAAADDLEARLPIASVAIGGHLAGRKVQLPR